MSILSLTVSAKTVGSQITASAGRRPQNTAYGKTKLKATEILPDGKQAITAEAISYPIADKSNDDDAPTTADLSYQYRNDGLWTNEIGLRVWDLTKAKPIVVHETTINLDEAKKQFSPIDIPENPGAVQVGLKATENAIFVAVGLKNSGGNAAYLYSRDLALLDAALPDRGRGVLANANKLYFYVEPSETLLRVWDITTGTQVSFPNWQADRWSSLALSDSRKLLLVRKRGTLEVWRMEDQQRVSTIPTKLLLDSVLTIGDTEIAGWEEGGRLQLWSLDGKPLGQLSGVGGGAAPIVTWNAAQCEAIVWTTEGQVLTFHNVWNVLGLKYLPKNSC